MSRSSLAAAALGALPLLIALSAFIGWEHHVRPALTGDEPCYSLQAQSLVRDGDLDISNDVMEADGVTAYSPDVRGRPSQCGADYRHDGKFRSWFNPGLPLLLAPVLLLTSSLDHLREALAVGASVFAWQLFGLLRDVAPAVRWRRWFVWAATVLLLPVIGFSNQIYPEVPAALALTVAGRCLLRVHRSPRWAWAAACAIAPLPLLHLRYVVLAGGITAVAATLDQRSRHVRSSGEASPLALLVGRTVLQFAPLAIVVAGILALYGHLYGSMSPSAPYDGSAASLVELTPWSVYQVAAGSFLGATQGLIPVDPVMWMGLAGLPLLVRRFRSAGLAVVLLFLLQVVVVNPMGFFGYTLPGRFVVVLLPVLAVSLLLALSTLRTCIVALLLGSLGIVPLVQGYRDYGDLLDIARPKAQYQRATEVLWPKVSSVPGVTQFAYRADASARSIGTTVQQPDGPVALAGPGDGAGAVEIGDVVEVQPADWRVRVDLRLDGIGEVATVAVRNQRSGVEVARRPYSSADLSAPDVLGWRTAALDFGASGIGPYVISVETNGKGSVQVGTTSGVPLSHVREGNADVVHGVPLAVLWLLLTTLGAMWLWAEASPSGRRSGPMVS